MEFVIITGMSGAGVIVYNLCCHDVVICHCQTAGFTFIDREMGGSSSRYANFVFGYDDIAYKRY